MHTVLDSLFQGLPKLPPKTYYFQKQDQAFINDRKTRLDKYLKGLLRFEGVTNTVTFLDFLGVPDHIQLIEDYLPHEVNMVRQDRLGVNQVIFDRERGVIFTACEEAKLLKRIDSHLTNLRMPWEAQVCAQPPPPLSLCTLACTHK